MGQGTTTATHPNASLTPKGRLAMVRLVVSDGWTISAAAERHQVSYKTCQKWVGRYRDEGEAGLCDRPSTPKTSPCRSPRQVRVRVYWLRRKRRWGPQRIAAEVGLSPSTVHRMLVAAGLNRLDRGDRATGGPPQRYLKDRPGELVHIDIKKLARIPDGGGWRAHGRGTTTRKRVGYVYVHSTVDDRTRLAYSETLPDEKAATSIGFLRRAVVWYRDQGIDVEAVMTDNGSGYRSGLWKVVCGLAGIKHRRTRPYRPQTNGKVERFHRILKEEWAYICAWESEAQRAEALGRFIHFYNHHRTHGGLGYRTPHKALSTFLTRNNVPDSHT